jgi:hypothetical protein
MGAAVRRTVTTIDGRVVVVHRAATPDDATTARRELARLRAAAHPGVVRVVAEAGGERPGYATAWVGPSTLATASLPTPELALRLAATAATLAGLHDRGLVHGRLTPARLLAGGQVGVVICGFGPDDPADGHDHPPGEVDVAGIGRCIQELTGDTAELEPIPRRPFALAPTWHGATTRALQTLADQATAEPPGRRPTMGQLAESLAILADGSIGSRRPGAPRRWRAALDLAPRRPVGAVAMRRARWSGATRLASGRDGVSAQGEVVAGLAHVVGDDPGLHEPGEDRAPEAEAEHRLERGGDGDHRHEHEGGGGGVEAEVEHGGRHRQGGADPLGEALRRPGDHLGLEGERRCEDPGDELAEGAERGPGEDPGHEPVGEEPNGPGLPCEEDDEGQEHHAPGDQAGRHLVDRVGELEQLPHA